MPNKGSYLTVDEAMRIAISEGAKGAPFVSPNPQVGCVILDAEGRFLSSGYHEVYGGPHAEINALRGLSESELNGAHVVVTLEPCAHQGKTPSCARELTQYPIAKVTYGVKDPNPLVSGQGAEILKKSNIEVVEYSSTENKLVLNSLVQKEVLKDLEELAEIFFWNQRQKKTFVAIKLASSLDGQIALKNGQSQWITGEKSRLYNHYLRACYDAILVGGRTIQLDNPSLNVRYPGLKKQNKVIILDPQAKVLNQIESYDLIKVHKKENLLFVLSEDLKTQFSERKDLQIIFNPLISEDDFNLVALLDQLFKMGICSIFVEGGGMTISEFLRARLVNRVYVFMAPVILGAKGGVSWTQTLECLDMQGRLHVKSVKTQKYGDDLLWTGTFF